VWIEYQRERTPNEDRASGRLRVLSNTCDELRANEQTAIVCHGTEVKFDQIHKLQAHNSYAFIPSLKSLNTVEIHDT
jgi:hypothetical protein